MTQQVINVGGAPNDGTGDTARASFQKVNAMMTELYGGAGGGTPVQVASYTTTGSSTFTVPATTNIIYLSGCGGGGGGGGGYAGAGGAGGGGGPAPNFSLLPISVTAGSVLVTFVGTGGAAGAISADGSDGTESYISGAGITSPYKNVSNQILMGYGLKGKVGLVGGGGDGGGTMMASTASTVYGTLNTGSGHASRWWYTDGQISMLFLHPIAQGSGGGAVSVNGGGTTGSGATICGGGPGGAGTGNGSGGGGGRGGGGPYGRGGDGGAGAAAGTVGVGYGAGGGGGGGNAAAGAGSNGAIFIWY